ncbi:liprin-beta-2b isoform X2 [Scleropages formosus]|uniref:liprin-beta-2b isoform X2 n=1 Tax=Scleropages formosus TaxID=113540 RepID=UPI000878744F|nr:liprin-beta-2-like isoform X2 [Scleropages formosus]
MVTMASDASHMLEAALEQMDGIIAGSKAVAELRSTLYELGSPVCIGPLQVLQLAEDLRTALELQAGTEDRKAVRNQLPSATAEALLEWLESGMINHRSPVNNESYQERLSRLEGDKESLVLQVSVLTDQVEAQGEKIRDLETSLEEHHHKLSSTEEMLQQELLSRTSLETQKLDLMDEVSYLKLKLVGMEEAQSNGEDKQHKAECVVNLISELQEQMCKFQLEINTRIQEKRALEKQTECSAEGAQESPSVGPRTLPTEESCCCREENVGSPTLHGQMHTMSGSAPPQGLLQELRQLKNKVDELEGEKSQYEQKLKATKAEIAELQHLLAAKDAEIECLQSQLLSKSPVCSDSAERDQELQRLKTGMESLLAANNEKDRRIEELTVLLGQYRNGKEVTALTPASNDKLPLGSSEEEVAGGNLRGLAHKTQSEIIQLEVSSRGSSPLSIGQSSIQKETDFSCRSIQVSPESAISPGHTGFQNGQWTQPRILSSSLEELQSGSLRKNQHMENKYQTLPGKLCRSDQNGKRETPAQKKPEETEDSEFSLNRCRSASAPVLGYRGKHDLFGSGRTQKTDDPASSDLSPVSSGVDSWQQSPVSPENKKNQKGIKKFWGKIRRTQSGSLPRDDLEPTEFRRGGLRATAGPRLACTSDGGSSVRNMNTPFSKWTKEQVCGWLEDYGLGQYVNLARQWVNSGETLLSATPQDFEKEMGIKHPLHRKKLQLAVRSFSTKVIEKSADLDHIWVTRWLDDIGLPQYKDQFNEARVDGRMLQYLTLNDLLFLKVTSQLHHLSIKSAIHVLHINKFNPNCLRRRPGDENKTSPTEVTQWSNHRVMEWLRSVDLAEYAPNLRGSGVHGGLIILEPRFNSDALAMLLNIPPQKTLLRRHLATNFNALVGTQAQQEKRQHMESSGYVPLTTTAKVRPKKLGFSSFGHLRKKKLDDSMDYICPMDPCQPALNGALRPYSGFRGLSPIFDRDAEKLEQVGQKI